MMKWPASAASLWFVAAMMLPACSGAESERLKATVQPTYDKTTGKLAELTSVANGNGRIDTWTAMDGTRPLRSRADRDEDGTLDRWEYYDASGVLVKVGFSRRNDGIPDAWAFSDSEGKLTRVEISSTADESRIDRWEHFDGSSALPIGGSAVPTRVEEDTNADGRPDMWETYENGLLKSASFDENRDGRPDRRLTYNGSALVQIESEPDVAGMYTKRVALR
jgi:hypothetical protein